MRRRDFLTTICITLANLLYPTFGRANTVVRAAVVIGINKTGSLPVLRAAASGATVVGDWLEQEGFHVHRFIDDQGPVRHWQIFDAVNGIVKKGIYDQLVIYFSGHGFLNSYNELWMLSGAPEDPNAAISLVESIRLCKRTGIQNVVFISDACRSTATSLAADSVRGSIIFPTTNNSGNVSTKADRFLAAQQGDPAYEVSVELAAGEYQGIYTASFLDAFKYPDDSMVTLSNGVEVVLNKNLEAYLKREVPKRAQARSITLRQRPDTEVLSDRYIGRVRRAGPPTSSPPPEQPTIDQVAELAFEKVGLGPLVASSPVSDSPAIQKLSRETGFEKARDKVLKAQAPGQFESQTGFSVNGAKVTQALANRNMRVEVLPEGDGQPSGVRLWPASASSAASVVLQFSDGTGTVVAGLPGFIGTIVVDDRRIVSVNYVP